MFVEIAFPADTLTMIDRDTVEDALTAALSQAGLGDVAGAGMAFEGCTGR